jgi:hypothetical protein
MIDGSRTLALGKEARTVVRPSKALVQNLERHSPTMFDVFGFVDFTHSAAA